MLKGDRSGDSGPTPTSGRPSQPPTFSLFGISSKRPNPSQRRLDPTAPTKMPTLGSGSIILERSTSRCQSHREIVDLFYKGA